jgi:hypothetical protein
MLSASKMATELFVKQGWKTPRWKEDEETRKAVWTTTTARQSLSGPTGAMETQPSSIQVSKILSLPENSGYSKYSKIAIELKRPFSKVTSAHTVVALSSPPIL